MSLEPDMAQWPGASLFARWRPVVMFYQAHAMKFYLIMLIKNLLFILPTFSLFKELAWLDCILPGRLLLGSRIPQASAYLSLLSWLHLIANKLLLNHLGTDFSLLWLEFCCHLHQQLKLLHWWPGHERQVDQHEPSTFCSPLPSKCPSIVRERFFSKLDGSLIVRRPGKTPDRILSCAFAHLVSLIAMLSISVVSTIANMPILGPMLITKRGFELTHESCVRFVLAHQAGSRDQTGYEFIYETRTNVSVADIFSHQPLPMMLPYSDFVPLNFYHILRFASDVLEVVVTMGLMGFTSWFSIYFVVAFSTDARNYVRYLRERLSKVAFKLSLMTCRHGLNGHSTSFDRWQKYVSKHSASSIKRLELSQLQDSICDYFGMIAYYNSFVTLITLININLWLVYTFLVFSRTLRVDRLERVGSLDGGVQFEFVAMFGCATLIVILMLSSTSRVNSDASKLYKAIVRVMVLERGPERSRKRWIALLNHFEPDKLYCFTLFDKTDLSWLLCIKIFLWVISALVILMSL